MRTAVICARIEFYSVSRIVFTEAFTSDTIKCKIFAYLSMQFSNNAICMLSLLLISSKLRQRGACEYNWSIRKQQVLKYMRYSPTHILARCTRMHNRLHRSKYLPMHCLYGSVQQFVVSCRRLLRAVHHCQTFSTKRYKFTFEHPAAEHVYRRNPNDELRSSLGCFCNTAKLHLKVVYTFVFVRGVYQWRRSPLRKNKTIETNQTEPKYNTASTPNTSCTGVAENGTAAIRSSSRCPLSAPTIRWGSLRLHFVLGG